MEETIICPYPGLRPFHEDEAIFFKGRDEHIEQITRQLEAKKFLMLTGASGDGKSSLVYAGLIPNARAGFFKAKFNNWVVADFRPERAPLTNMGESIGNALNIGADVKIEKELSYGFSSLIDLYKNSKYWVDQNSDSFKNLSADDQKKTKRKGANLLILVDQFEEFFTNPENYSHGKVSIESQTVVNLLLETTRLAIEQDIPIYIVCTMRSDYIGQCASFRGLPEYIGYSQFFVPRLKRKEVYQVIEEPALLNGNKISKRLVEMLINEMNDGIDQLPVLQHALNQIWQKADKGTIEMDVIHFAKINGIPKNQLSKADKVEFETWFESIPEFKKVLFVNASLGNVLDAHANELYETSGVVLEDKDDAVAKLIVEKTFKCLTKIDESRAVRNRMSLLEVTQIINDPAISSNKVGKVLDVFRIQGNTFVKPFITDDKETHVIKEDDVLDITHESLIRNWNKLTDWAKEEHDNLLIWQDFNKQLQRWAENNKSSGYLLPIGPLTFFETWFNKIKPNKYWLARYDERDISREEKLKDAENDLANANQFIKRSARRLFVSRTVMKYGVDKIITVFGLALLIFSCTYFFFDFRKKQNDYVIKDIQEKGKELLHSNKIKNLVKAQFVLNHERLQPNSLETLLDNLNCDTLAYDLASKCFALVQNYDDDYKQKETPKIVVRLAEYMENKFSSKIVNSELSLIKNIKRFNDHVRFCAYYDYYTRTASSKKMVAGNIKQIESYVKFCMNNPSKANAEELNLSIKIMLNFFPTDSVKVDYILDKLSPFKEENKKIFDSIYPLEQTVKVDWDNYLKAKGGYQTLAYLYACEGDFEKLERCLDSLYIQNESYKKFNNDGILDIQKFIVKFHSFPSAKFETVLGNCINKYKVEFSVDGSYKELIMSKMDENLRYFALNDPRNSVPLSNFTSYFISDEKWNSIFDKNLKIIKSINQDRDGIDLNVALYYKMLGIYYISKKKNIKLGNEYFQKAMGIYKTLPVEFLSKDYIFYDYKGKPIEFGEKIKNSVAFLFPDAVINSWSPLDASYSCDNSGCYQRSNLDGSPFFRYLDENKLLDLYKTKEDLASLEKFEYKLVNSMSSSNFSRDSVMYTDFETIANFVKSRKGEINENFVQLVKLKLASIKNDTNVCKLAASKINLAAITNSSFQKVSSIKRESHVKLLRIYCYYLASTGKHSDANKVYNCIQDEWDKKNCLIDVAYKLTETEKLSSALIYIDSLLPFIKEKPKFGMKFFRVFGMIGTKQIDEIAMNIFKDIDDKLKPRGVNNFVNGIAKSGMYYKAFTFIPKTVSSVNELALYNEILHAEVRKRENESFNKSEVITWEKLDKITYGEFIEQNYEVEGEHFERFAD